MPPHPAARYPVPPALSPSGQPLASFSDRLLAYLIDSAVFVGVGGIFGLVAFIIIFASIGADTFAVQPDGTLNDPNPARFLLVFGLVEVGLLLVMLALYYVYFVEMTFRTGQSLGKRVMKIKIVRLDPAATFDRGSAAKRYLVQFVAAMIVPGLGYLDGLWQLWDKPHQQCLHDKFARTVVVKVPG